MATKKRKGGPRPRVGGEKTTRQLVIRMAPSEYELLYAASSEAEESISDFVRTAIEQRAKRYGVKK